VVGWSDGAIIGLAIAMWHPERLRRLFAYGANSDPSGARPDMEGNATWTSYIERTRGEYRQLSPTPQDYDTFLAQIQAMWAQQPNFPAALRDLDANSQCPSRTVGDSREGHRDGLGAQ